MSANTHIQLPFTTSHAFIVGINDYQHLTPLSTAVNDARVIAERLADQHGFTVHPPLLNATHESLRKLLTEDIPKLVGKDDRVLFYFAGHGIALDGEEGPNGYLVAADTRPGQEETLIPMATLHDALTTLPCRHGLLILDCCFSGAFKWSTGFRDVVFDLPKVIYEERFWRYCKDPAWQVITSSAHDQKAVDIITNQSLGLREEGGGTHSPFAASLLKALGGDGDMVPAGKGDGVMTATEIYSYLRDSVETQTTENAKRQSPSIFNLQRHDKGEFIFLNPNHRFNLPPTPDRNPFMGLLSYNEEDANLFYGRDRVVETLRRKVSHHPLIVVSGASGTGKSSVIKAGVLPQLRKQGYTVLPIIRPGKEPLQTLLAELPDIKEQLAGGSTVLVVDQYEELITQCLKVEDRLAFEQQIATWLEAYQQLRVMLSIRSDFEPQFESEVLAPWWQKGRYVVPAFSLEEIREVITRPAAQAVLFYEPEDLVEQLSEEVSQAPGALPLLSFTLSELYHAYLKSGREDRALTEEDYNQLGGVIGALRTRADAEYQALNPDEQSSMRKLMLRMVSLEGGELAGKRVYTEELQFTSNPETERLQAIANRLVDARLLLKGTDGQGRSYIEPAHDALVRAWARLWEWIKTVGEEKITLQYKLSQAVNDYHSFLNNEPQKARNLLWNNNPRLDLLQAELQGKDHGFNAQEEAFVRSSVQRRSVRKRTGWGIAVAVMIGLAGLSVYAFAKQQEALTQTEIAQRQTERAELKTAEAVTSDSIAQLERDKALDALEQANLATIAAQQSDSVATLERDRALVATEEAIQQAREAKAQALAATSREVYASDPTTSLNLAYASYHTYAGPETAQALFDVLSNPASYFYRKVLRMEEPRSSKMILGPNDNSLLIAMQNGNIHLVDANTGQLIKRYPRRGSAALSLALSPNGRYFASGGEGGELTLWAIDSEMPQKVFPGLGRSFVENDAGGSSVVPAVDVWDVAFSPDGTKLLSAGGRRVWAGGGKGRKLLLWSVATSEVLQRFEGHQAVVYCAAFTPDGKGIVAGDHDRVIKHWDVATGQEIRTFKGHDDDVTDVLLSKDGRLLMSASADASIRVWDLDTGAEVYHFADHESRVTGLALAEKDAYLISSSADQTLRIWDVANGELLKTLKGHQAGVSSLVYQTSKKEIISNAADDHTLRSWPLQLTAAEQTYQYTKENHNQTWVRSLHYLPNGKTLIAGTREGMIRFWSTSSHQQIDSIKAHSAGIMDMAISQDGSLLVSAASDQTYCLWDVSTRSKIRCFEGHKDEVHVVAISPDQKLIVSSDRSGQTILSSVKTGAEILRFSDFKTGLQTAKFSADGRYLLGQSFNTVLVCSVATGREVMRLPDHGSAITAVELSEDGKQLVVGDESGKLQLYNFPDLTLTKTFFHTSGKIMSIALSPDGRQLAATNESTGQRGQRENYLVLWSVDSNLPVFRVQQEGWSIPMAFSPSGKYLLAGAYNKIYRYHNILNSWNSRIYQSTEDKQGRYNIGTITGG